MMRYQIRLAKSMSLSDVLWELTGAMLNVLESHQGSAEQIEALKTGIKETFEDFIKASDFCGLQAICEDGLEPAEWNIAPDPELSRRRHPWQSEDIRRLSLDVEQGLEEFIQALEAEIFRRILTTKEVARRALKAKSELDNAIKNTMGKYLYKNIAFGNCELCKLEEPKNIWQA